MVTLLTQNINTVVNESNKTVLDAIASAGVRATGANETGDGSGGTDSAEVKAAVANLQTMLEAQSVKMDELAERGKTTSWTDVVRSSEDDDKDRNHSPNRQATSAEGGTSTWTGVVKMKKNKAKPTQRVVEKRSATAQRVRSRPTAILVDVS